MSRSIESLLERQFEAMDEVQDPVTLGEILDHARPVVAVSQEAPRLSGVGSRIGVAAAVIAVLAITLVLAWYTSTVPSLDPADGDGIVPQPTTPSTLSAPEPVPITPTTLDLLEPTIAGSAFDVGWTLEEHQLDLSGLGEPQTLSVRQSVGLFWALQYNSDRYWVSDDGTSWDPVEGDFGHMPADFGEFFSRYRINNLDGFLRIDDTIVIRNSDAMWVSTDRGRNFIHVEARAFEGLMFAWSWVADDAFWVITEHPDRVTLNTPESPNASDEGFTQDETKPRQLWTSHDAAAWTLVGDVEGLPPRAITIGDEMLGELLSGSAGIAVDDHIVLTVLPASINDGRIIFHDDAWLLYRSTDEGLSWEPFADLPSEPTGTVDGWIHAIDAVTDDGVNWYTLSEPIEVEIPAGRLGEETNPSRTVAVPPPP